ncbi:transposase [Streptococcus pneumoniae]|nr:transposase [Streptococcus pneumoniae]
MSSKCYQCSKIAVAETSLVKKNHQIPRIINQKIAQKLIEKISMTDIAKLNDFHFKHDFSCLPEIMSWDEYAFTKGKMSFIAQDFNNLNIITVLEGRTQAIIRNHFLRYDRVVRCRVKIITMDMFSPYYDLAKQLRFQISRLRLKQSPRLFHSRMLKSCWIAFTLYNILAVL